MGLRDWPSVGSRQSGLRSRKDTTYCSRQRSLWHSVQPRRWRSRYVRIGGRRRVRSNVRLKAFRAFHHHIWRPAASPFAAPGLEQAGPQLSSYLRHGRVRSDHTGCACAVHSGGQAQQPQGLCQWDCVGAALVMPYLHSRSVFSPNFSILKCCFYVSGWPPSADMGHPADAARHRRPDLGLHGRVWDQSDPVGEHPTRLDRYLLQQ